MFVLSWKLCLSCIYLSLLPRKINDFVYQFCYILSCLPESSVLLWSASWSQTHASDFVLLKERSFVMKWKSNFQYYSRVSLVHSVNAPYSIILFILKDCVISQHPYLYTYPVIHTRLCLCTAINSHNWVNLYLLSQCVSLQNESALLEANITHFIGRILVSSPLWPKIFSHAFNPDTGKRPNGPPEI